MISKFITIEIAKSIYGKRKPHLWAKSWETFLAGAADLGSKRLLCVWYTESKSIGYNFIMACYDDWDSLFIDVEDFKRTEWQPIEIYNFKGLIGEYEYDFTI